MRNISRVFILNQIFSHFQMYTQQLSSYADYLIKAEALIVVLEVSDCGSSGGYDKDNHSVKTTGNKIFDRFLTLLNKHNDAQNIDPICGFDVDKLSNYFIDFRNLRQKALSS